MLEIPIPFIMRYQSHLVAKGIAASRFGEYKKWLQFFLDYCEKYQIDGENAQSLSCNILVFRYTQIGSGLFGYLYFGLTVATCAGIL